MRTRGQDESGPRAGRAPAEAGHDGADATLDLASSALGPTTWVVRKQRGLDKPMLHQSGGLTSTKRSDSLVRRLTAAPADPLATAAHDQPAVEVDRSKASRAAAQPPHTRTSTLAGQRRSPRPVLKWSAPESPSRGVSETHLSWRRCKHGRGREPTGRASQRQPFRVSRSGRSKGTHHFVGRQARAVPGTLSPSLRRARTVR